MKLRMIADRETIKSDGQDLVYVTVEVLDSNNNRDPLATDLIHFKLKGPGSILSVGSSDPMSSESFKSPQRKAFQGRCQVIIKSEKRPGSIVLKASSEGIVPGEITIATN